MYSFLRAVILRKISMRIALVYFNVKRLIICVHNDKFLFIISKLDYIVNNSGFDILTYNLGFHSGKDHNLNMSLSMSHYHSF